MKKFQHLIAAAALAAATLAAGSAVANIPNDVVPKVCREHFTDRFPGNIGEYRVIDRYRVGVDCKLRFVSRRLCKTVHTQRGDRFVCQLVRYNPTGQKVAQP